MRAEVTGLLGGQPAELIQDALLVLTELVDNVVQHTDGGGELHVSCEHGGVRLEAHDHSRVFPQLQRPDPRRAGGRGLLLIAGIARSWGSRPTATGKVVWAQLGVASSGTELRASEPVRLQ